MFGNELEKVEAFLENSGFKRGILWRHSFVGKKPPYDGIRAEVIVEKYGYEQTRITLDYTDLTSGDEFARRLLELYPQ